MIDLYTGETYAPVVTIIMVVVIVVVLVVALNMRKKIERNEDRGGLFFTPQKLRIEPVEDETMEEAEAGEVEEQIDSDESDDYTEDITNENS
jgi:hypothetical protein